MKREGNRHLWGLCVVCVGGGRGGNGSRRHVETGIRVGEEQAVESRIGTLFPSRERSQGRGGEF